MGILNIWEFEVIAANPLDHVAKRGAHHNVEPEQNKSGLG